MSFCKICQEEINADSQYINGYWYHNNCIEHLQEEYEKADYDRHKLFEQKEKAIEYINTWLFEAGGNGAEMDYDCIVDLLNILQGVGKDD